MSLPFFGPKTLGSLFIGSGALCGGGVIYWYQMPRTWQELLTKEGFVLLSSDEDYKGMFNDQQNESIWKNEDGIKDANEGNVKEKTDGYCKDKLKRELSFENDYDSTKQKLIFFCTSEGIKSVKARLIQSNKSNWIEDNQEDKWKTVFAVYRYEPRFIEWLKEDSSDSSLSETSSISDGFGKLKTACTKLLAKSYRELTDEKYFNYASWWCTDLGYTTIKERLEKGDSWSQENDGEKIKNAWKDTQSVTDQIKQDQSKTEELQGKDYKDWCDDQLKKKLNEEGYYQDRYIKIKSVCQSVAS